METPKDRSGAATERIMEMFSRFNPRAVAALQTEPYNRVYEAVYRELRAIEDLLGAQSKG